MSLYSETVKRVASWFMEHRVDAIKKGTGLKPWTDTEDGYADKSVNEGSKEVFSTKEEFEAISAVEKTNPAIKLALPAVRAAFLQTQRKTVCQACSGRLARYERTMISSTRSANNLTQSLAAQEKLKEGSSA